MGARSEFYLSVVLDKDVPEPVIAVLHSLVDRRAPAELVVPPHPFFEIENWPQTFAVIADMWPFPGFSFVRLDLSPEQCMYSFSVRTIFKGEQFATEFIPFML